MMKPNFTIRIYGIYIQDNQVLLSREKYGEVDMLKFPGGGLEYGEGTLDCLKREMFEEFELKIEVLSHLYTTDFFVDSVFHANTQVMSIYYYITPLGEIPVGRIFKEANGQQQLLWHPLQNWDGTNLSFPVDRHVAGLLTR
jgi:ADP-ribose pyrophosphatase YjhB (NUDIX family)